MNLYITYKNFLSKDNVLFARTDRLFVSINKNLNISRLLKFLLPASLIFLTACSELTEDTNQKSTKSKVNTENLIETRQQQLNELAKNLIIEYEVIDNRSTEECLKIVESGLCFQASINFQSNENIELTNWKIFFSHMNPILEEKDDYYDIEKINGDLYSISPTKLFAGWARGTNHKLNFKAAFWHISEFDSPPNFYIVVDDLEPAIIQSTIAKIDPETNLETMSHVKTMTDPLKQFKRNFSDQSNWATAAQLFKDNKTVEQVTSDITNRIIPKPTKVTVDKSNKLDISKGLYLDTNDFDITIDNAVFKRLNRLGVSINTDSGIPINLIKSTVSIDPESYQLTISSTQIMITASEVQGAFYGLQSIASLFKPGLYQLPLLTVDDNPHYAFRGLHLDVARNFRDVKFVVRLLDQMAAYKLNKLHLHLGDDEGWRMEIPGLPELTQIGGQRCHDLSEAQCLLPQLGNGPSVDNPNNGFYSVDDYRTLLVEAKQRQIEVIPSFDMPGHSRAAVVSMQARFEKFNALGQFELANEYLLSDINDKSIYSSVQYYNDNTLNVCREQTYHFIEKVIDEVIKLHHQAGVPLNTYHIGADETPGAWTMSPQCEEFRLSKKIETKDLSQYFIVRVSEIVTSRGLEVAGWSDGLGTVDVDKMPAKTQANAWTPLFWDGHKVANKMANQGWKVVLSLPDVTYFDFPYEADPKERGYYWGSRNTNTRQVFNFMPDNLPLHAEIWNDRENKPMVLDDTVEPLKKGKKFAGIQGHLWSEMVRSDDIAEYLLFPRLIALAERAWHKPDWQPAYNHQGLIYSRSSHNFSDESKHRRDLDWQTFASTLSQREFIKLDIDGWDYRIPTIGAKVSEGKLLLNSPYPGLAKEFKINDGDWLVYTQENAKIEIRLSDQVQVRARNADSSRYGRSLTVKQN